MAIPSSISVSPVASLASAQLDVLSLHLGQVIEAEVVSLPSISEAVLAIKGQALQALLAATLAPGATVQPGQTVTLKVLSGASTDQQGKPTLPQLQVLTGEEAANAKTSQTAISNLPLDVTVGGKLPATGQPAPQPTIADIIRTAIGAAATQQNSLAPLYANLAALGQARLPPALREVVDRLLDTRLSPDDPDLPKSLAKAFSNSGVFLEAHLTESGQGGAVAEDIKSLLLELKQQLSILAEPETGISAEARARPPLRGEAPLGQPASQPSIEPDAPLAKIAAVLRPETEAAIARIELSQYASINSSDAQPARAQTSPQWTFEIPIALNPQQTVMAQFQLVHERPEGDASSVAAEGERSWKVRFSVDTAENGPVQAQVSLRGGAVSIFLSADRPETVQRFQSELPDLVDALQAVALQLETVQCLAAAPRPVTTPAGSLMNVRT